MIPRACSMLAAVLLSPCLLPAGVGAQENPYVAVEGWAELPAGREWGAVSAVYPDGSGNLWVIGR